MKVYFVSSGLQGCYLVRCLLPLQENGWDGDQVSLRMNAKTPENKAQAAQDAEVIVFHRPDTPQKLVMARMLREAGKKIVFDNDDTVKDDGGFKFNEFMDKERLERGLKTLNDNLDSFIKEADLVTCSTEFLKKEYEKLNPNVVVLPNCIDPFMFDEPIRNDGDKVRVGIVGSVAVTSDMDVLMPIVEKYHKDPRIELVLLSMPPNKEDKIMRELYFEEYKFWESVQVEWHPFVPCEEYLPKLNDLRLDMMIIPRADSYFNRCKSNIKFLEASMLEIPVVAQSFPTGDSPYEVNPEDAKHVLLATDHENWISQMEKLITDKDLRRKMGKIAREYVLKNYTIENHAGQWVKAYSSIL